MAIQTEAQKAMAQAELAQEAFAYLKKYKLNIEDKTPEEAIKLVEKIKESRSKVAQVLRRGRTLDALDRILARVPKGFVGQFAREDELSVARKEALGFEVFIDPDLRDDEAPHGTGDGRIRIGDQILMIIPEAEHAAIKIEKYERAERRREARNPKKEAQEEMKKVGLTTFEGV